MRPISFSTCRVESQQLEPSQKKTCHEYVAQNGVNQCSHHTLYTGIGAGACARHGCYVPGGVVNFTKGEK